MNHPLPSIGFLERVARFVFKPHLKLDYTGPRKTETVAVYYQANALSGQSRYVRVWVHNSWGYPAHNVEVFVDRILLDGVVIENERSALHWCDFPDTFEYPKPMKRGERNGHYVDVCAADSIDPRLQILTMKGLTRGYQRFQKSGEYTLELSAEAQGSCCSGGFNITVKNDGKNWKNLEIVSAKQ
jgi:hypothetical protein